LDGKQRISYLYNWTTIMINPFHKACSSIAVFVALIAAGCTAPASSTTTHQTQTTTSTDTSQGENTLVIGYAEAPDTLYGFASNSSALAQVLQFIQPGCVTLLDYSYQPVCFEELPTLENGGLVSETVTVAPEEISVEQPIVLDGALITDSAAITQPLQLPQLTARWTIKQGIRWEDGTSLTADDFVFTWQLARHPDTPLAARATVDRTLQVEKIGERTFSWTGVPGNLDPTFATNFAWDSTYAVYPKHILGTIEPATISEGDWSRHPISYGPFKVESYVPQEQLVLRRNPYYWRASEGLPKTDRVIFKFVASTDQLLAQFHSGDIDIAGSIGLTLREVEQLDQWQQQGQIAVQVVPGTTWEHLDFGMVRGDEQASFFDDVRVRQAFAYGIDRQQIVDEVLRGRTTVMHTLQPPGYWAYPERGALKPYRYNPQRAQQLLDEAGWVMGSDGVRVKDGRRFVITLHTTQGNQTREAVAQIIQHQLGQVGIVVALQFVPAGEVFFAPSADGTLAGRRFDLALYAWQAGVEPSLYLYRCDEVPSEANNYFGVNYGGYCNPHYDRLDAQANSQLDRAQRAAPIIAAERIVNHDLPTLPLYQDSLVVAYQTDVAGVKLNGSTFVDFSYPEQLTRN
jgi:peptide/nickel transport system substrate-binding protein